MSDLQTFSIDELIQGFLEPEPTTVVFSQEHNSYLATFDHMLALSVAAVNQHGFISKSQAYQTTSVPTADVVTYKLSRNEGYEAHELETAMLVKAWLLEQTNTSDYILKAQSLAESQGTLVARYSVGIIASLYSSYLRQLEQTQNQNSEFYGSVDDKVDLILTVASSKAINTLYGTSYINTFFDDSNHVFVWFTGSMEVTYHYDINSQVRVTGRIKEHKEYNGTKQTILTYAKVNEV